MLDRQRGAAHVPVIVFLLTLIAFFGALAFGYFTLENNNKLEASTAEARAELRKAQGQIFLYKHYISDLAEEVGETGSYEGREGFDYSTYNVDPRATPLENVTIPSSVNTRIGDFARAIGVPQVKGISGFFSHIKNTVDQQAARIASLEGDRAGFQTQIASLQAAVDAAAAARAAEVSSLNGQITQGQNDFTAALDQKNADLARRSTAFNDVRDELTNVREDARQKEKALNSEIEVRDARIAAQMRKTQLINPPQAADAMVLKSSQAAGRAWINIGRNDMLAVGTTFRITGPDSDKIKAYGTVARVERDRAELLITGVADRYDFVARGDEVHNDLYSPNVRRTVYLLGRFGLPHTKPMVKRILENLGNTVVDEITPAVDLVIIGGDEVNEEGSDFTKIMDTDAYKQVTRLNIETATLNKIRDFLKLGD